MGTESLLFHAHEHEQLCNVARSLAHVRGRRRLKAEIQDDLGALGLVLHGLVGTLVEKGVITRDELVAHLRRVDDLDGAADGKVTPDQVRAALGLAVAGPVARPAPLRRRKRR